MNQFQEEYNLKIENIFDYVTKDENYQLWNKWRQNVITKFVKRVYEVVRKQNKDLLLSIAVGPTTDYAKINLMQDWSTWVLNGWIDIVAPMAYVRSKDYIKTIVIQQNEITQGYTYNYTGIAPTYDGLPNILNTYFIDESNQNGALGSIIFAYHNLADNDEVKEVLRRGTHRYQAISPHQDIGKLLEYLILDIKEKSQKIYVKSGLITIEEIDKLIDILNRKYLDLNELKHNIELAIHYLIKKDNVAAGNIIKILNRFIKIINIKKQRRHFRKENKNE
ncbi:MAG: family 10 glycosylhydrolase [Acholeplasmataceae bacterium]